MNHYETLGISRDASPDDIKQAWRRLSSEHHPDRDGGDAEKMAAVNRAYETLSNEQRRAEYDATGTEARSIDHEARDALLTLFHTSLESEVDGDHVQDVAQMLEMHRTGLLDHQSSVLAARKRLERRRKRIRVKSGENLVHGLIDQKIAEFNAMLAKMPRGLEVNRRAAEMLSNYEMTEETLTQLIQGWKAGT